MLIETEKNMRAGNAHRIYDWSPLEASLKEWGVLLNVDQRRQVENYLELVACQNLKSGLTADIAPQTLLLRHAADALACVPVIRKIMNTHSDSEISVADLGSGGGFIGVTLKIALPEIDMTLIEPLKRRFDFLNLTLIALGLRGLHLTRKPANPKISSTLFNIVIERALAPFPKATALAETLLKPQGFFIAYQSQFDENNFNNTASLESKSSPLAIQEKVSYRLPLENKTRYLILSKKEA